MNALLERQRPVLADRRGWVIILVGAVGSDLFARGLVGLGGALLTGMGVAALFASGRLTNRRAWPVAIAASTVGLWLVLRTTPWLIAADLAAAAGLLVLASSLGGEGDPLDLSLRALLLRVRRVGFHLLAAPLFLRPVDGPRPGLRRLGRGLFLAAPLLVLLGILLGSADPVFASFFDLDLDPDKLVLHAVLLVGGGWVIAGLLRALASPPVEGPEPASVRLGSVEAATVLGSLVALYGAFAAAQLWAAAGGARHVLETERLTYAEYARSGFFQLLAVAAITLVVLGTLRVTTERTVATILLSEAAVLLTLLIVAVALRRLHLYEAAYGLTTLRLLSSVFAWWIGSVFVMLGLALAGVLPRRSWLTPAALTSALVILVLLNASNPEAVVVRRNLSHFERTGRIDVPYLTTLSEDAIPAASELDDPRLRRWICGRDLPSNSFLRFNWSRHRALEAQARYCPRT